MSEDEGVVITESAGETLKLGGREQSKTCFSTALILGATVGVGFPATAKGRGEFFFTITIAKSW